jgi:DNA-binding NarL/FixJ family response regulator
VEVQALLLRHAEETSAVTTQRCRSTSLFGSLSKREQEVLQLVAQDKTDRTIADHLGIAERTVRAHVSRIILKLSVASRVGAAVAFVEWTIRGQSKPM